MDTLRIHETSRQTLTGTISFPEVVRTLLAAGVETYHVDYIALRKTFYGADGTVAIEPLNVEGLPPVAPAFAAAELQAAIRDSQLRGQHFRDFSRRAMAAGVQGYLACLRGRRVVYWGRTGDLHTEWFPGAGPLAPQP